MEGMRRGGRRIGTMSMVMLHGETVRDATCLYASRAAAAAAAAAAALELLLFMRAEDYVCARARMLFPLLAYMSLQEGGRGVSRSCLERLDGQ